MPAEVKEITAGNRIRYLAICHECNWTGFLQDLESWARLDTDRHTCKRLTVHFDTDPRPQ